MRGRLSQLAARLAESGDLKGEVTLLVAGSDGRRSEDEAALQAAIRRGLAEGGRGHAALARELAEAYGLSRREAYERILAQQKDREGLADQDS
jgi:16S rRNA C1402 (ribose-2'-O) methylase RsmI